MGIPLQVSLAYTAASATAVSALQSPGAGAILINGGLASGGVATLDAARRILFTSGTSDTGITFTVVGTNAAGKPLTETITGGAATASTTQDFKTVTSITHTGSVAGTLTVGTSGVGSSPWLFLNYHTTPVNIGFGVVVSGTINYSVEYTMDDPNAPYTGTFPTVFQVSTDFTSKATSLSGVLNTPAFAMRVTQNSFTNPGNLKMIAIQAGLGGGN